MTANLALLELIRLPANEPTPTQDYNAGGRIITVKEATEEKDAKLHLGMQSSGF